MQNNTTEELKGSADSEAQHYKTKASSCDGYYQYDSIFFSLHFSTFLQL